MEDNERDAFDRELIIFGAVWGFAAGWGSYAAYRQDWLSVVIVAAALIVFLICRHSMMKHAIGVEE